MKANLKRFLVFGNEFDDVHGGWSDFQGSFNTLKSANEYTSKHNLYEGDSWFEIVDTKTGKFAKVGFVTDKS